jgi:hypothetical protein
MQSLASAEIDFQGISGYMNSAFLARTINTTIFPAHFPPRIKFRPGSRGKKRTEIKKNLDVIFILLHN